MILQDVIESVYITQFLAHTLHNLSNNVLLHIFKALTNRRSKELIK